VSFHFEPSRGALITLLFIWLGTAVCTW